jgi:flavin-dependent thymidylate synthase
MTEILFRDDFDVQLVDVMGDDQRICDAARVSTLGDKAVDTAESFGLINFLMKNRHGSPFEHLIMSWRISAPIFVWREYMRHRIASYNEQSGRYMQLEPVFYVPPPTRAFIQVGKPGHYTFEAGSVEDHEWLVEDIKGDCIYLYGKYERRLERGYAKEVARMTLPVNIYSTAYVTMNARGLMNFLSLRTKHEDSMFPSYPQDEINRVANLQEFDFIEQAPLVARAFQENGRVQP